MGRCTKGCPEKKEWGIWGGAGEIAFLQLRFVAMTKS